MSSSSKNQVLLLSKTGARAERERERGEGGNGSKVTEKIMGTRKKKECGPVHLAGVCVRIHGGGATGAAASTAAV